MLNQYITLVNGTWKALFRDNCYILVYLPFLQSVRPHGAALPVPRVSRFMPCIHMPRVLAISRSMSCTLLRGRHRFFFHSKQVSRRKILLSHQSPPLISQIVFIACRCLPPQLFEPREGAEVEPPLHSLVYGLGHAIWAEAAPFQLYGGFGEIESAFFGREEGGVRVEASRCVFHAAET